MAWVLLRAFGPEGAAASAPPDAHEAVRLAERLGLAPRIASRHSPAGLLKELGETPARRLLAQQSSAVAIGMVLQQTAAAVAGTASALRVPILFLKGIALHLSGLAAPESRPCADLDLLSRNQDASALRQALGEQGFRAFGSRPNPQHLAPLFSPHDVGVDIHFRLRGVDLGSGWATAEELLEKGHGRPLPDLPGETFVPCRQVLAAHALVHGIEQHGLRPAGYPLLRMVGDLCDLLPGEAAWDEFLSEASGWISEALDEAEVSASRDLCLSLARGRMPASAPAASEADGRRLLDHFLHGSLDPGYSDSLRLAHTMSRLRKARDQGGLLRYISTKLFVADPLVESGGAESGRERRPLLKRLSRPFALLSAAFRAYRQARGEERPGMRSRSRR